MVQPRIASPYGMRERPSGPRMHNGIDIVADEGAPVHAVLPGVVTHATANGAPGFSGYGHTVVVRHDKPRVWTLYAHLLQPGVVPGQVLRQGDVLGWVGKSRGTFDRATGTSHPDFFHADVPHLHFEVRTRSLPAAPGDGNLDPQAWLASLGLPLPTSPGGPPVQPPRRPAVLPPAPAELEGFVYAPASSRPRVGSALGPVALLGGMLGFGLVYAMRRR